MNLEGTILSFKILCIAYDSPEAEKAGLNPKDLWLNARIDLSEVIFIKENGKGDHANCTTLYTRRDLFVTDVPFTELAPAFTKIKNNKLINLWSKT